MKEFYKNKKVLVTGHTGFQGAWLAEILLTWGAEVTGVSLEPHTNPNLFEILNLKDRLKHIVCDIRDAKALEAVLQDAKPDIVFHLAAQALVRPSYDEPRETYEANVQGTVHVLDAIRFCDSVQSVVVVTTDKVYEPNPAAMPYTESTPLGGFDPYSASKAAADIATMSYARSFFGVSNAANIGIARSGNVIGGGDWGTDRLVPDIMRAVYEQKQPVIIRNPHATRPWQHVFEPLNGYLLLAQKLYEDDVYVGAWNFGPKSADQGVAVEEVVKKTITLLGSGEYHVMPDASKHEAALLELDISKAQKELLWQPNMNFDETIAATCAWYKMWYEEPNGIVALSREQIQTFFN